MAQKKETKDTASFLRALQKNGWFRKTNDEVQVGLPDILGCHEGYLYGIEIKAIKEVPKDGMVPLKSSHTFTKVQVRELNNIDKAGGLAWAVIICGRVAAITPASEIDENGQVCWHKCDIVRKIKGAWDLSEFWDWS